MSRVMLVVVSLCLLWAATQALAMDKPVVTMPTQGAALGPNYDIAGYMPYRAFLVVLTDAINAETGELIRTVPGIRHWTNADGTFQFRVASPRVSIGETDTRVKYRVRVFEATPQQNGPETVIMCEMAW
jgi:hypothetical protein